MAVKRKERKNYGWNFSFCVIFFYMYPKINFTLFCIFFHEAEKKTARSKKEKKVFLFVSRKRWENYVKKINKTYIKNRFPMKYHRHVAHSTLAGIKQTKNVETKTKSILLSSIDMIERVTWETCKNNRKMISSIEARLKILFFI